MKAHCKNCREWDARRGKYVYHMAALTEWIPPLGYEPTLRQFYCSNCGSVFYKVLSDEKLFKAKEETKKVEAK